MRYIYAVPLQTIAKANEGLQGYNNGGLDIARAVMKTGMFVKESSVGKYWRPVRISVVIQNTTERKLYAAKQDGLYRFASCKIYSPYMNPRFTMEEVVMSVIKNSYSVTFSKNKEPISLNGYYIDKRDKEECIDLIYNFYVVNCKSEGKPGAWFTLDKFFKEYFSFAEKEQCLLNYLYAKNKGTDSLRF